MNKNLTILVTGGRDYKNKERVKSTLDSFNNGPRIKKLVFGDAKGADTLALEYAIENSIPYSLYKAQWDLFGLLAGPIRNTKMLNSNDVDMVVAFPGGKGTANMIKQATDRGIVIFEVFNE